MESVEEEDDFDATPVKKPNPNAAPEVTGAPPLPGGSSAAQMAANQAEIERLKAQLSGAAAPAVPAGDDSSARLAANQAEIERLKAELSGAASPTPAAPAGGDSTDKLAANQAEIDRLKAELAGSPAVSTAQAPAPADAESASRLAANQAEIERLKAELAQSGALPETASEGQIRKVTDVSIPLEEMPYPDLQQLAKAHGVKASQKKAEIIEDLKAKGIGGPAESGVGTKPNNNGKEDE